jgi:hypothetical protein
MSFWDYVRCFQTNCYPAQPRTGPSTANWTEACQRRCVESIDVAWSVIQDCVTSSGGVDAHSTVENTLLREDMNLRSAMGVFSTPTMLVNQIPYRGSLVCPTPIDISHCGPLGMICEVKITIHLSKA